MGGGGPQNPGGGSGSGSQNASNAFSNASSSFPSTPTNSTTTSCANASAYNTPGAASGAAAGAAPAAPKAEDNINGYGSQDAAAKAALNAANPASIRDNKEYGGVIYKDSNGKYHYSGPAQGTDQGFDPSQAPAPAGTTVAGDYHTHGDYSTVGPNGEAVRTSDPSKDQFNSDHFSATDKSGIAQDGQGNPDYRGYLGTPSGSFKTYNPTTGTESTMP